MIIGALGTKVIFEVSADKVMTFNDLKKDVSGNWGTHNIISQKAKSEFLGANLQTISFTIHLNAMLGVRPAQVIDTLEKMVENGEHEVLSIGCKKIGKYTWKVTSISETYNTILNKGEILSASVDLSLEEYV